MSRWWSRLLQVLLEQLRELRVVGAVGGVLEQLDGLRLDRMRVLQILVELRLEVVARCLGERGFDRFIEAGGEPFAHRPFLVADPLGDLDGVGVAGALGHA